MLIRTPDWIRPRSGWADRVEDRREVVELEDDLPLLADDMLDHGGVAARPSRTSGHEREESPEASSNGRPEDLVPPELVAVLIARRRRAAAGRAERGESGGCRRRAKRFHPHRQLRRVSFRPVPDAQLPCAGGSEAVRRAPDAARHVPDRNAHDTLGRRDRLDAEPSSRFVGERLLASDERVQPRRGNA